MEGLKFVLDSKLGRSKEEIEGDIKKLGGSVGSRITDKIAAVISTKDNVKEMDSKMKKAEDLSIPVIELSFLDAVK